MVLFGLGKNGEHEQRAIRTNTQGSRTPLGCQYAGYRRAMHASSADRVYASRWQLAVESSDIIAPKSRVFHKRRAVDKRYDNF
jgi:hypothetical protein